MFWGIIGLFTRDMCLFKYMLCIYTIFDYTAILYVLLLTILYSTRAGARAHGTIKLKKYNNNIILI